MLNELDSVLEQYKEKKNNEIADIKKIENEKTSTEFEKKFENVFDNIIQSTQEINEKLASENIKLEVINGVDNEFSNRKALQVFLSHEDNQLNVLESPYLLIEGYSNQGSVRIVTKGASDNGLETNINDIDHKIVSDEISKFVIKSLQD